MVVKASIGSSGGGSASLIDASNAACIGVASSGNSTYTFNDIPETKECIYAVLYGTTFTKGNYYNLGSSACYPVTLVFVDASGNCIANINAGTSIGSASISGDTLTITGQQSGKSNVGLFLLAK